MKQLLYYSTETGFTADQTNHGGDGTKVVSTINGVALAENTMNTFYRYGGPDTRTAYTVTVRYYAYYKSGNTLGSKEIAENDTFRVQAYKGKSVDFCIQAKNIEGYAIDPSETSLKKLTVSSNVTVTFYYYVLNNYLECIYEITDTENPTVLYHSLPSNYLVYTEIDGKKIQKSENVCSAYTFDRAKKYKIRFYFHENGLTSIESYEFSGTNLYSVTFPSGVTSIGSCAFADCKYITGFTIPDTITGVGRYCFSGCTSLKELIIGNNVQSDGCLYGLHFNTALERVVIGDKVPDIPEYSVIYEDNAGTHSDYRGAFYGCTNLKEVQIGTGVTFIGQKSFYGTKITNLVVPDNVTELKGRPAWDSPAGGALEAMDELTALTIGTGVTSVQSDAYIFSSCEKLRELTLKSPTVIEMITKTTTGDLNPLTWIGGSFRATKWDGEWGGKVYDPDNAKIYVPSNLVDTYKTSPGWDVLYRYAPNTFCPIQPQVS